MADSQLSPLESTRASLERIKKNLTTSGRFLLHGSLLKRSQTLRKWNERWFTLDPTTGKMEYRIERGDVAPKGTPGAAQAWVSTLQAAQLVLKAHREAVNALGGSGLSNLGTLAAVVAAANATAQEAAKQIATAMKASTMAVSKPKFPDGKNGFMDGLIIMKETLRVKDEELHQVTRELRARDATIKEMTERLSETTAAAEAAASAAHIMDKERKALRTEIAKLRREMDEKLRLSALEKRAAEEKLLAAERDRDEAFQEARTWHTELTKAREHGGVVETALPSDKESARNVIADTQVEVKAFLDRKETAHPAKDSVE